MLFLVYFLFLLLNLALSASPAASLSSLVLFNLDSRFQILNSSPPLPLVYSWSIALDNLKSSISVALFGLGLGNFHLAFFKYRPLGFNSHELWFIPFDHSVSPALTVLVEQGIIGIILHFLLFYSFYRLYRSYRTHAQSIFFSFPKRFLIKSLFVLIAILFLLFLFNPLPIFSGFPLFSLISLISLSVLLRFLLAQSRLPQFSLPRRFKFLLPISLISLIASLTLISVFSPRFSPSHFASVSRQSILQAERLAETHPENKKKIAALVKSALSESKTAISLDVQNPLYWENLAEISLKSGALLEKSADITVNCYQEAIKRDPYNPRLFIELGKYQFFNGDFAAAAALFSRALELKPGYPAAKDYLNQAEEKLKIKN